MTHNSWRERRAKYRNRDDVVKIRNLHKEDSTVGWDELLTKGECPDCGSNRMVEAQQTAGAVTCIYCAACNHEVVAP